jgi:MtN3 and saliva related transmembrane protein
VQTLDVVGYIAASLTTFAFVPQVIQAIRTRDLRDVSLAMYVTFWLGIALWLVYGIMLSAWPIIIANALTLVLSGIVLVMKLRQVWAHKGG